MLDRAIRELDRERMGLQNQEKKLIADIKKMAKDGQMVGPPVHCRDLAATAHTTVCPSSRAAIHRPGQHNEQ
jgi:charged multivesicular body protein 2A